MYVIYIHEDNMRTNLDEDKNGRRTVDSIPPAFVSVCGGVLSTLYSSVFL